MENIVYAETAGWERWMREYRYGAFYIFPSPEVVRATDILRERYDPESARICQTHISLSEPLLGPLTDEQLAELEEKLKVMDPFEIHYGPLRSFPPYPGLTYTITPEDRFFQLREMIHATSLFAGSPLTRKDRAPHMTIAEFITLERTDELLRTLQGQVPEGSFLCDSIEWVVPDQDFHFKRPLVIRIGKQ